MKILALVQILNLFSIYALADKEYTKTILVDKKTNLLYIVNYTDKGYEVLKTYHTTVGQVQGDKETEGDLKTPEGVYFVSNKLLPPALKPKFGAMGLHLNYPNRFDQLSGHTGSDIMIHGTNEPDRLKNDYDSEGCIVLRNEQIQELDGIVDHQKTPVLVFDDLKDQYFKIFPQTEMARYKSFFESWINSWKNKELDNYISHYHSEFVSSGKDVDAWKAYKGSLNRRYKEIEITPTRIRFFRHPKYSVVVFVQEYRSKTAGGGWGHRSTGTKTLFVAEENHQLKIISEDFSRLVW